MSDIIRFDQCAGDNLDSDCFNRVFDCFITVYQIFSKAEDKVG